MFKVRKPISEEQKSGLKIWTLHLSMVCAFLKVIVLPLGQPFGIWESDRILGFPNWH